MKMLKLDESYVDEKITRDHPCVKGKFPRAGGGGLIEILLFGEEYSVLRLYFFAFWRVFGLFFDICW